jgi:L-threonate 2-dehydrogenase
LSAALAQSPSANLKGEVMGTSDKANIGVIGIGAMGMGIARSLARHGHRVHVRDVREEAHEEARSFGAKAHASPAALAQACDVIWTVVVDHAQTEEVLFGEGGAVKEARPGTLVVASSTVAPGDVESLAAQVQAAGLLFVDAPISGGPAKAAAGTMSVMYAGAQAALDRFMPLVPQVSGKAFAISQRAGDAMKVKVVNNMLAATHLVAAAEAFTLAERLGLDLQVFYDVACASSGQSWMLADRMGRALKGDKTVAAAMPIITKDIGLAVQAARANKSAAPLAAIAENQLQAAIAAGFREADDGAVWEYLRTTVTLDDTLYEKALELAEPGMDMSDIFREAIKTFIRVQAGKRLAALGGS